MEDNTKCILRKICCACLCVDRRLTRLCRVQNGVNNLFFLLSSDSEAYTAMFRLDATSLFVCWECLALMRRQRLFREQVCVAQKRLTLISDGQVELKPQDCLSKLTKTHQSSFSKEFVYNNEIIDNFVDCTKNNIIDEADTNIILLGTDSVLDSLSDEELNTDNINNIKVSKNRIEIKPLLLNKRNSKAEITNKRVSLKRKVNTNKESKIKEEDCYFNEIKVLEDHIEIKPLPSKNTTKRKKYIDVDIKVLDSKIKIEPFSKTELENSNEIVEEEGFTKIRMSEEELLESIEERKLESDFVDAVNKCDSCVEAFKSQNDLERHNSSCHVQKPKFIQCDICQVYVKFWWLPEHKNEHYLKYQCHYCTQLYYNVLDVLTHLKDIHSIKNTLTGSLLKKLKRKAVLTNPVLAPKRNVTRKIIRNGGNGVESTFDFECPQCGLTFESKYLRYKHILKQHREGHKCPTCGKTFAFKNTLNKHEQIHGAPQPTQPCPVCGKMVRLDRVAAHARIHSHRAGFDCAACDKRFVSRDSYEKHLKYSKTHAVTDVHKYKCTMCDKGFRTARELSDHVDYKHMGTTRHQCPLCHKALATRRCVTRHVNRAHRGLKESTGDRILCHACGRAFRDQKTLREHQLIHTGEKPLSCDVCGRAFRQSACLYTHKRRVHKMAPARPSVRHAPPAGSASTG